MKFKASPYLIIAMFFLLSCTVSKEKRDKQDRSFVHYLEQNKDQLRNAAAFAIDHTWDKKNKEFRADTIRNKKARRLLLNFGMHVSVYYNMRGTVYDSTVTFKVINFSGVKEVIYSFAEKTVERTEYSDTNDAFIRVSENIYYARRPFPMM